MNFERIGTVFLGLNSASPGTKQQCAALIDAAVGHDVKAGVFAGVGEGLKGPAPWQDYADALLAARKP